MRHEPEIDSQQADSQQADSQLQLLQTFHCQEVIRDKRGMRDKRLHCTEPGRQDRSRETNSANRNIYWRHSTRGRTDNHSQQSDHLFNLASKLVDTADSHIIKHIKTLSRFD